jgi:diguanylate cyclase (GGDEF)-like protein
MSKTAPEAPVEGDAITGLPATILVVDDDLQQRRLLESLLRPQGYLTITAANGEQALAAIADRAPDLILLDGHMPGMDGYQLAARLKAEPLTAGTPIIMVTAQNDRNAHLAALNAGAEDFLCKPVDPSELRLRVRNLLRLKEYSDFLKHHAVILEQQVQARTADLQHLAHYDSLTGLPNRSLFQETLGHCLAQASDRGWMAAVLFIDLDHFKNVNDTLGHALGDELLRQFADRLIECVRSRDTVGRLGGDEFGLILLMSDGQQGASRVAHKVLEVLRAPFDLDGREVVLGASIGITVFPADAADAAELIKYADTAMYQAKQAGRGTFRFFTAQMNSEVLARLELETALRKAVENEEFVLHYQPKVQLDSGRVVGLEALLRWQRPGHGLVPPQEFIPALEEMGLITAVGRWVIASACRQIGLWARSDIGPMPVAVNVSGRQFNDGELDGDIIEALVENDVAAQLLELELTESSLMANTELTLAVLGRLKKTGVRIAIDDFGTGYSSLAYLRRFPIDKLKIDIAFIRHITSSPDDAAIAVAIIGMARSLKLEVIAEGVETAAQLEYLRRQGCDAIQGNFFSPALPLGELERLLRAHQGLPTGEAKASAPAKTLLLVDDETEVLTALQMLLRQEGYQILAAHSADEGFEMLALHPVQVILCDQRMPGMSGTDFLDRVKVLYPDTLRIALSGHADLESLMDAINRGAIFRFSTKPWDNQALVDNIRDAFRYYWLMHGLPGQQASAGDRAPM